MRKPRVGEFVSGEQSDLFLVQSVHREMELLHGAWAVNGLRLRTDTPALEPSMIVVFETKEIMEASEYREVGVYRAYLNDTVDRGNVFNAIDDIIVGLHALKDALGSND